jgi:hypothetical protein
MYKTFITGLSLGLLVLMPSTLHASNYQTSEDWLSYPFDALLSTSSSNSIVHPGLRKAHSTLSEMSVDERAKLAKQLGSSKRTELESAIPEEHQDAAATKESNCLLFWKSCFRVSAKTLGSLAIDIILDLSDGKLDGNGPTGPINYIHNVADIINAAIDEYQTEKK